ncbi:MAG TPA: sugar transferase, partial [Thauera sp.]|nr:sugar transferase [Thauera sp.]
MNPAPAVQALAAEGSGVVVTGTVPDVRPFLAHAQVVVAPLRIARGIQNKVLEAMAMARPVVLTQAPAAGLAAQNGRDCEVAADEADLAARVLGLLGDDARRARMGEAALDCVLRAYSWSAHLRVLDGLLDVQPPEPGGQEDIPTVIGELADAAPSQVA